jgi:equilibrative nucleoside transporter 1/2/3
MRRDANGVPRDTWHLVLVSYFMLGVGSLLVWNAFITALDYFAVLYPGQSISTLIPAVYTPGNLASLIIMLCVPFRIDHSLLIRTGFTCCLATLSIAILLNRYATSHPFEPASASYLMPQCFTNNNAA